MGLMKFSCMVATVDGSLTGIENYEAPDIVQASEIALSFAMENHGIVLRVESCDFGPFEYMR